MYLTGYTQLFFQNLFVFYIIPGQVSIWPGNHHEHSQSQYLTHCQISNLIRSLRCFVQCCAVCKPVTVEGTRQGSQPFLLPHSTSYVLKGLYMFSNPMSTKSPVSSYETGKPTNLDYGTLRRLSFFLYFSSACADHEDTLSLFLSICIVPFILV